MLDRRNFFKSAATGGLGLLSSSCSQFSKYQTDNPMITSTDYFGIHPFIEEHPEAVFIMRTNVDDKTNARAIKETGINFGRSVFGWKKKEEGGIPTSNKIAVKPNLTCSLSDVLPLEYGMGIVTDVNFVEGTIEAIKELWVPGSQFHIKEVNCTSTFGPRGYLAMAERTGADLHDQSAEIGKISSNEVKWCDVPDGWIHKNIPYLWPVNTRDTMLINIAKFKTHDMGMTLCCKNHQGSIAHHYQQFCGGLSALKKIKNKHLVDNYEEKCKANNKRHVAQGIPRWDKPDRGLGMDIWATRTLDNLSVSPMGLCVVEGIYGRDGDAFFIGPNKGKYKDNEAWDYMTNIIIFGRNPVYVDIIGTWLGGHEPGNFGIFHLALEREMSSFLNPMDIPVYLWENGKATLTQLTEFERTSLKTPYLCRDYNGQNEPAFHLVDEYFDYSSVKTSGSILPNYPVLRVLSTAHPKAPQQIPIEFSVPRNGYARIELYNSLLRTVDVPVEKYITRGYNMIALDMKKIRPGTCYCRFRFGDFDFVRKIDRNIRF